MIFQENGYVLLWPYAPCLRLYWKEQIRQHGVTDRRWHISHVKETYATKNRCRLQIPLQPYKSLNSYKRNHSYFHILFQTTNYSPSTIHYPPSTLHPPPSTIHPPPLFQPIRVPALRPCVRHRHASGPRAVPRHDWSRDACRRCALRPRQR